MKWKSYTTQVENLTPGEARTYIKEHGQGEFTLLDVRQPKEYEATHIPGARLLPLPELEDRLGELDPSRPVLTYCAVGGRSRAAAQYLAGHGFEEVLNLQGGIKAWEGLTALGPEEQGMSFIRGDETEPEMLTLAFGMEEGLADFYRRVARDGRDPEVVSLLEKLAGIEDKHKDRVWELYTGSAEEPGTREEFESRVVVKAMEGGFTTEDFLARHGSDMDTVAGTLSIAMMLEAQALDLYGRYARKSEDQKTREALFKIADEEKEHLAALGRLLDEKV